MEFTGAGGGVMIAVAAILWLVYLVPSWFRDRQYFATERNAVRLQQTIRVLAETAEMPHQVRRDIEVRAAVAAAGVARAAAPMQHPQQEAEAPVQRHAQAQAEAPVQRHRRVPAQAQARTWGQPQAPDAAARRRRRGRAASSAVLLAGIVVGILQVPVLLAGAAVVVTWIALGAAVIASAAALGALARLASMSRQHPVAVSVGQRRSYDSVDLEEPAASRQWTPVALPRPLYLDRPLAAGYGVEMGILPLATQIPAPPSRFAAMGIVPGISESASESDALDSTVFDLDAAFARRRRAS